MKRTTKFPSVIFQSVLKEAEEELAKASKKAANYEHKGIRGNERANALRTFFSDHLPKVFATGKGEAIDFADNRTGEIDFCIYDAATASPIQSSSENSLIPAEALYVVVEVKSVLTQNELNRSALAAKKVRSLRPFKNAFVASPTQGEVSDGHRCLYIVFAFTSNLGETDWAQKEFNRIKAATAASGGTLDMIDSVMVLDRGLIRPQASTARLRDETKGIFLEFYLHVVNFLSRERKRRPEIDWAAYASSSKSIKLS